MHPYQHLTSRSSNRVSSYLFASVGITILLFAFVTRNNFVLAAFKTKYSENYNNRTTNEKGKNESAKNDTIVAAFSNLKDSRLKTNALDNEAMTQPSQEKSASWLTSPTPFAQGIQINFQDSATKTPVGWLRDFGQAFGPRTSANQGGGAYTYGWEKRSDNTPLDLTKNGRFRTSPADTLLATLMHMQGNNVSKFAGTAIEGIWEIQIANGNYDVTVSVGDGTQTDSKHTINVEGLPAIVNFVPTTSNRFKSATVSVTVADGLLTVDAIGGTNTKINYINIQPGAVTRPSVVQVNPENGAQNVSDVISISTSILNLPNGGVNNETLTSSSVFLQEGGTGAIVPAHVNGTGGGDAITLVPQSPLKLSTTYIFNVTDSVKDLSGASFIPFASTFTTGSVATSTATDIKFTKVQLANTMGRHSSLTIGPDGKLYALTIDGVIKRFTINRDGTLQEPQLIYSLQDAYGPRQQRLSVGFAFDPASTATNLIAYVTHDTFTFLDAPDWDGKLTRLSGTNLQNVQDILINLPRSAKDHVSNSIAFGPDGALYFTQGGTSAMGSADQTWSMRDEHLLSAAVLRLDFNLLGTNLPLDVKTQEGGGSYNPYSANAPLTIYASGVRNAYDLVWHSNGELYTATNGSAAGGNTPASVQGTSRPDGSTYTGPDIAALTDVQQTQRDFLYRIKKGGYYGHPNPLRGEYVMNGGNPTASVDPGQVNAYPVGTMPDANWRGFAFDFRTNKSPNGSIEYKSNTFGGALKGKLMIVRYSQNDDIIVLTPGGANNDIISSVEGSTIAGLSGFVDPLDLTEDVRTGNLYVSEYGGDGIITLLRPDTAVTIPIVSTQMISSTPSRLYDNDVAGGAAGPARTVTLQNTAQSGTLTITSISLSGANPDQFVLSGVPTLPFSLAPGESLPVQIAFNPSAAGLKTASLLVGSDDPSKPSFSISLRGQGTTGTSGSGEPSLQAVLNLLEIPLTAGDDNASTAVINSSTTLQKAPLLGEEVSLQQFLKADASQPVTLTPLAVFGPSLANNPVLGAGWYTATDASSKQELFTVPNTTGSGQTVNVTVSGTTSFDPGSAAFGFYSRWPYFSNRLLYSEDALNTFSGALPHHVRVYPYKDPQTGAVVPFTYLVAFEENTSAADFQDLVFIVKNVKAFVPASVVLNPVADALVRDGSSSSINFGRDTLLHVKGTGTVGNSRYTYLKFSLGKPVDILSAKLRLYGRNTESTALIPASVFGVDADEWTETGLTWNNAPASLSSALGTAAVNNQAKYYEVDVTSFVQTQFQKDGLVSFMMRDSAIKGRLLAFNSRENVFNQPQLVITTSAALAPTNAMLFVENLDKFPSNTDYMASRLQTPWSRDGVTFNTNHDTLRIRLWNKGSGALTLRELRLPDTANWKIVTLKGVAYNPSTQLPLTLTSGTSADVQVKFLATDQAIRVKASQTELSIVSNDDKQPYATVYLRGLWQKQGEGAGEPTAQEIISAFGFKTNTGFTATDPDLGANDKPKGDEVLCSYFVRADPSRPVGIRQMSAYHDCCNVLAESLRWYPKGKKDSLKTVVSHIAEDAQSVLPRRSRSLTYTPSEGNFSPTTAFGFKVGSKDWTDTLLNPSKKIGIRVWKAIDARGYVIPNAYIISNDYLGTSVTNYDYNDNMYYITNVRPELGAATASTLGSTPSAVDFGEQVLQNTTNSSLSIQNLGQVVNNIVDPSITVTAVSVVGQNSSEFTASMPQKATLAAGETTTLNINFTPSSEGLKVADLLIYYNNAGAPLRVPLYGIGKALGTTVAVPYRIKSGSSTDVTVNGKTYVADTPYAFDNLGPSTNPNVTQVNATDEDSLYLKELSSNGDKRAFRYEMPLANGTYWIKLHFAEIYWGALGGGLSGGAGSRVMAATVEGEQRIINLDIFGEAGSASALVKVMPVTVKDGKLNITFFATVNRPTLGAVEVYQFATGGSTVTAPNGRLSLREQPEAGSFEKPRIYPNPLHNRFTIQFPSVYKGQVLLQLTDVGGRTYELGKAYLQAGGVNMDVDLSKQNLKPGIYFLRIEGDNNKAETIKLLLE